MPEYLGQHFLKNKEKLQKIVDALELKNNDIVIEIGPGHGELTEELRIKNYELGIRIIAIEKDGELTDKLKEKFSQDKNIEIIQGDALKILPELKANNYKIVGNIPYYITGYLFRILGELEQKPSLIVLLIQKEVAERICVEPPKMNLLAASVQIWAEPKIIDYVLRKDFLPQPKVDSAIIKLAIKVQPLAIRENTEKYYQFIKIIFKQPRKTIVNNLVSSIKYQVLGVKKEEIVKKLQEIGMGTNARPQNLSIEQIKKLLK